MPDHSQGSRPVVAHGTWLYDGAAPQPVRIVALAFDYWYALGEADDQLEPNEKPAPLGPDGVLYYASFGEGRVDSSGCTTIADAKAAAQERLGSPIRWYD
jgi:hypothetical protein